MGRAGLFLCQIYSELVENLNFEIRITSETMHEMYEWYDNTNGD